MGERRNEFPGYLRRQVRREQDYRCGYCNGPCRGHDYGEPTLQVHHITPAAFNGRPTRENAIGLCDHTGNDCHHRFDNLYFQEGKTVFEVFMEEGRWHDLSQHPGNPYRRLPR